MVWLVNGFQTNAAACMAAHLRGPRTGQSEDWVSMFSRPTAHCNLVAPRVLRTTFSHSYPGMQRNPYRTSGGTPQTEVK